MEEKILVSIEEAAHMIGVSKTTAYQLVRAGVIPTVLLGRIRRVPIAELKALGHLAGDGSNETL